MRTVRISLAAGLIGIWAVGPAVAVDITAEAIAEAMGFGAGDRAKLQAGEIVSTEIEETTEKQLAVALALKVPATLEDVAASVAEGTTLEADRVDDGSQDAAPWLIGSGIAAAVAVAVGGYALKVRRDRAS